MHPMRRIEEIRSATDDGGVPRALIREAIEIVEVSTPIGAVMATVATQDFVPALIEASEERSPEQERAWLTLAAAEPDRTRQVLAKRALTMIDPNAVIVVLVEHRDEIHKACDRQADTSADDERQGAWSLIGTLTAHGLESAVWSRRRLRSRYLAAQSRQREERRSQGRSRKGSRSGGGRINPVIAVQFKALGLI